MPRVLKESRTTAVPVGQVTQDSTVKRMWMSVQQIPVTTEVYALNDPTSPITEHDLTSPVISAIAKQPVSSVGANQALQGRPAL